MSAAGSLHEPGQQLQQFVQLLRLAGFQIVGHAGADVLAQQRYDIISGSQTGNRDSSTLSNPSDETDILSGSQNRNRESIILSDTGKKSDESVLGDNLAKSLKEAMSEQPLKLEITMVNDKGERKTYNAENNGRITTAMNY